MTKPCMLIGDIGGTHARFALAQPGSVGFEDETTLLCSDFSTAQAAISAYLREVGEARPEVICLAVAGPVIDGKVRFTNIDWELDSQELQAAYGGASVQLLNDFAAAAYSIPLLKSEDTIPIGPVTQIRLGKADFKLATIGPGTGLGVAGLYQVDGKIFPISGEGGHVGFSPETPLQFELLTELRKKYERVYDERLASGPGIINIYQALGKIRGESTSNLTAAEVFSRASNSSDPLCVASVEMFYEILGQVAGNLALSIGAFDGVFIGGGIAARVPQLILNSPFRVAFENKGVQRSLMEQIPTRLILHPQVGLLGARYCAEQMLKAG